AHSAEKSEEVLFTIFFSNSGRVLPVRAFSENGENVGSNSSKNSRQTANKIGDPQSGWKCIAWHTVAYVLGDISGLILYFSGVVIAERLFLPSSKRGQKHQLPSPE